MSVVQAGGGGQSSSLADVIDTILDKGLVIDAHVSVGVVGIEILTVDARVVVAGVDTYLRFAEAANRLDLREHQGKGLPEVVGGAKGAVAGHAGRRAVEGAGEKLLSKAGDMLEQLGGDDPPDEDRDRPRRRKGG
jgi:hypothetical protein